MYTTRVYGPISFTDDYFNQKYKWEENLKKVLEQFKTVDTERYDIVEKKDYKLKRLQKEIESTKNKIGSIEATIESYKEHLNVENENLTELKKELKELES